MTVRNTKAPNPNKSGTHRGLLRIKVQYAVRTQIKPKKIDTMPMMVTAI